ncbi:cell division protein FtsQ/DivIB [Henriciella aquimarina]|uniref:cell division protein FtsQ/DivIB n=1 Tax=Henriciella aquimarina TaxID=545261 RepID=UPI0009FE2891|nr:cell division protein FtsQ/DivIB [Henriciella aquimarina]
MPQVRGRQTQQTGKGRSRRKAPPPPPEPEYDRVEASSVVFGLVMVFAVIVTGAALMGGSLAKIGDRFGGAIDGTAGALGFGVADVKVVGLETDRQLAGMVERFTEIEHGDNMFRANPHAIRRRIMATGQVTDARVYRLWPNQILVHASPAEPVALWHNGEEWKVVDSLGRIMTAADPKDHARLLRIAGKAAPDGTPALMRAFARHHDLAGKVSYAQRVSQRRWDLKLKSGMTIQLPSDARIDRAAVALAELDQSEKLTSRAVDRIDLRVPGKTYLKPTRSVGAGSAPADS